MRSIICIGLLFLTISSLPTTLMAGESLSPREIMDGFCRNIVSDADKAVEFLGSAINFGTTKSKNEIQEMKFKLLGNFEKAEKSYGKIQYCSFGHQASIGEDLKKVVYVLGYSLRPILLTGYFFKINNGWRLFTFNYSDDEDEFPYVID